MVPCCGKEFWFRLHCMQVIDFLFLDNILPLRVVLFQDSVFFLIYPGFFCRLYATMP